MPPTDPAPVPTRKCLGMTPRVPTTADTLQLAHVAPQTDAEGPGARFAVWFQGCPLRCPGCCNPEFLPFRGGTPTPTADVVARLGRTHAESPLEGVSLLGGEPFSHAAGGVAVARAARDLGLGVMIYSGFTLAQLRADADPDVARLLALTDLLVDGPYDRSSPDTARRWVGSTNQGVHFLSGRYDPLDACWRQRNTIEIRVRGREVEVNGFPAAGAVGLWQGWTRKAKGGATP